MFHFPLKAILNYRQHLYQNAQVSLAVAQKSYEKLNDQRVELKGEIDRQDRIWKEKQLHGMHAVENCFFREYLHSLELRLIVLDEQLMQISKEIEEAREVLLERKKEVQILDSMEQDAKQDFRNGELKKEQKQLDEVVLLSDYYKNADK
jgi:flagellar export protein FliJ